ncbi:fe2+ zn2+ uptake regulation protein [Pseudomonas sp. NPDC089554]|uniref:fe2+ zn2+ uptake regulation protein n=1 Tax=Pseudomonas sp. NPDC089554 TaxID=3390653 RepID=UPI003D01E230
MYNSQPSLQSGRTPGKEPSAAVVGDAEERIGNEQIRELLRAYGLRTSLIRLKVIDALHSADRNGRSIGVRGVHTQLEQLDIPLSFLSVREVLKRLCTEGVISLGSDKCYSLQPQARAVLEQSASR